MTEIQKVANKPERCIIAHPFNPPHLMPLVEVVPGKQTSERTAKKVCDFFIRLGKVPVLLKKEVPGYIANRLSAALWREAIDLVSNDVATVEDVDKALSAGPGLRSALMGPHMTYHLGGEKGGIEYFVDHLGPAFESWWRFMNTWTSIPHSSVKKVIDGVRHEMGTNTLEDMVRWRDDKLIELLRIIYDHSGYDCPPGVKRDVRSGGTKPRGSTRRGKRRCWILPL
jgi:3-hydroxyacyl-CoA dehydrogenase